MHRSTLNRFSEISFPLILSNDLGDRKEEVASIKEIRDMVQDFYQRMLQITAGLKAKHLNELSQLQKLKGDKCNPRENDVKNREKEDEKEDQVPTVYGCRLRSKRRKNRDNEKIYSLNYVTSPLEMYYDNLSEMMKRNQTANS